MFPHFPQDTPLQWLPHIHPHASALLQLNMLTVPLCPHLSLRLLTLTLCPPNMPPMPPSHRPSPQHHLPSSHSHGALKICL
ncbi:hypothetical protein O181_111241 [Austropuccinia psidii MF-1]|uniref:Uncharacterized protein n=1 Tax=Austropuccinia psidii MF-1 TaxID=1389203 RepID=A0A9Q3K0Q4_9BASI|nr:hypothetical protein [Austropuccinia psidii MF-1]